MLALALGLIAAAPYVFHAVVDLHPQFGIFGTYGGPLFSSVPYTLPDRAALRVAVALAGTWLLVLGGPAPRANKEAEEPVECRRLFTELCAPKLTASTRSACSTAFKCGGYPGMRSTAFSCLKDILKSGGVIGGRKTPWACDMTSQAVDV